MKFKIYTELILKIMLYSIVFILFFSNISSAAILTSDATPNKIFRCGESTISATFDDVGITSVRAWANATDAVNPMIPGSGRVSPEIAAPINITMTFNGTYWVNSTFGDNSTMLWGNRGITYVVTAGGTNIYPSSTTIFVYNSASTCTGTGKNSYQNYTRGIGNYTNKVMSGDMDLLTFSIYPWIQYWGYLFYMIVIFVTVVVIYMKTQNAMHVLYSLFVFLLVISATGAIDVSYRSYVISFIALCIAAVLYRLYARE